MGTGRAMPRMGWDAAIALAGTMVAAARLRNAFTFVMLVTEVMLVMLVMLVTWPVLTAAR